MVGLLWYFRIESASQVQKRNLFKISGDSKEVPHGEERKKLGQSFKNLPDEPGNLTQKMKWKYTLHCRMEEIEDIITLLYYVGWKSLIKKKKNQE